MSNSGPDVANRRRRFGEYLVRHNVPNALFIATTVVSSTGAVVFSGLAGGWIPSSLWFLMPAAVLTSLAPLSEFARGLKGDAEDREAAAQAALRAKAREDHDQRRYEQFNVAVKRTLTPLSDYIGRIAIAKPAQRETLIAGMGEKVVQALNEIIGKSAPEPLSLRSAFYEVEDSTLVRKAWDGRPQHAPRERFRPRSRDLGRLMSLVRDDRIRRLDDVQDPSSVRLTASFPGDYRAVICCGVNIGGKPIGILSVDTPIVSAFTDEDEVFMLALAKLFGAALVLAPRYQVSP